MARGMLYVVVFVGFVAGPVAAQFNNVSDGSDGAFAPVADVEIDLWLAADASWDTPSLVAGQGVYDADRWAVVFKYTTIDIPAGVTVTLKNHPSNPPVVWLASGDVTIAGTINLDMGDGKGRSLPFVFVEPGSRATDQERYEKRGARGSYRASGTDRKARRNVSVRPTYDNSQVLLIAAPGGILSAFLGSAEGALDNGIQTLGTGGIAARAFSLAVPTPGLTCEETFGAGFGLCLDCCWNEYIDCLGGVSASDVDPCMQDLISCMVDCTP